MRRWQGSCALLVGLLVLGGALGLAIVWLFDPPFLTWQHAEELAPALEQFAAERLPGTQDVSLEHVRAYTDDCSVIRARIGPDYVFWALLYREEGAWQVTFTQPEGGLSPLLAWGELCAEPEPVLPPLDLPSFE